MIPLYFGRWEKYFVLPPAVPYFHRRLPQPTEINIWKHYVYPQGRPGLHIYLSHFPPSRFT